MKHMEEHRFISSEDLFTAISEQLALGRQATFTVTGMSMWPFLCHGRDQVVVGTVSREDLHKGDIVLYRIPEGKYVLHRITSLHAEAIQTTGDGNLFRDQPVSYSSVAAKVFSVVRKGKRISCSNWKWRLASHVWMNLFPFRRLLLRICTAIGNGRRAGK